MKTWHKVLAALAAIVLGFVAFVLAQPSHFALSRKLEVAAPASKIYPLIADFHGWLAWSPWDKLDPTMKRTYAGSPSGVGQTYEWQGNKDVGKGKMTIVAAEPGKLVTVKLEFIEPIPATNDTRFELAQTGDKTTVTWTMEGENVGFMHKAFGLFMDRMVGPDFEAGLAGIKLAAEKP